VKLRKNAQLEAIVRGLLFDDRILSITLLNLGFFCHLDLTTALSSCTGVHAKRSIIMQNIGI
jgi:hypothetical protein